MNAHRNLPYVWDYDMDEATFLAILRGERTAGRLNRDWAAIRLLEYAPYRDILRFLGFVELVRGWPRWRARIRSESRRRGLDFLVEYLPAHHAELLAE
ncbi:MAG: hypothetical protein Fur0018_19120 [Anaerolineales bacterium]